MADPDSPILVGHGRSPVGFRARRKAAAKNRTRVMTVNMTPMIDVVFNLLIYFVLTASFAAPEGLFESKMPRSHGLQPDRQVPISPLRVRIDQSASLGSTVGLQVEGFSPNPSNFQELADLLKQVQKVGGYSEKTPVIIAPKDEVPWDAVVNAYNAAVRAAYSNINFGRQ